MSNDPIANTNRLTRATIKSILGDGILYLYWSKEVKPGRKKRTSSRLTPATSDNKAFVYVQAISVRHLLRTGPRSAYT